MNSGIIRVTFIHDNAVNVTIVPLQWLQHAQQLYDFM